LTLGASDVLDYLPVTAFVPDAISWSQLREECRRATATSLTGTKFKQWLVSAQRVALRHEATREACTQMGPRPPEFTGILAMIDEVLRKS